MAPMKTVFAITIRFGRRKIEITVSVPP